MPKQKAHHDRIHVHPFGLGTHLCQRPLPHDQTVRRGRAQAQTFRTPPDRAGGRFRADRLSCLHPRIPCGSGTQSGLGVLRHRRLPVPHFRLPVFRAAVFLAHAQQGINKQTSIGMPSETLSDGICFIQVQAGIAVPARFSRRYTPVLIFACDCKFCQLPQAQGFVAEGFEQRDCFGNQFVCV